MLSKINLNNKIAASSQPQEKTTPILSNVEKAKTPTPQKHDHEHGHGHRHSAATHYFNQNLLAPLKNDKNFISKIV